MLKSVIVQTKIMSHFCIIKEEIRKKRMNRILIYILTWVLLTITPSYLAAQAWLQRYSNGNDNTSAQAMDRTADGGYFFCGSSDNSSRLVLVKTDAEGGILATQKFDFGQTIEGNVKMTAAGDGTFWIAFSTTSSASVLTNKSLELLSELPQKK